MPVELCSVTTIEAYLNESLSPADEVSVERHLDDCEVCRQRMSQQAGSGDDWSSIAGALRVDEFDDASMETQQPPVWPLALLGPTDDPRMLGRIGPFEVSGCVGIGGMGVVFKARDPALDRYVAVKVLAPHLAASDHARRRFAREAKAAAAVVHDNVIAIHQVSEYQGLPFLVMPYLPGPSLADRIERDGALAPLEALRVARQVAAGLKAAHQQGLIHRDIKPANILLSGETERAVITDFGLARAADDATLTRSGTLAGTPQFMAPEQARGEPTDARSDLFSLGALLFAMLTGRAPVEEPTGAETIRVVGQQAPPALSAVLDGVPPSLEQVVRRLHAFDRSQRVESADEAETLLTQELRTAGQQPLSTRHDDRAPLAEAWFGLQRRRVAALAVVCLGLLGTLLLWLLPGSEPPTEQRTEVTKSQNADEALAESSSIALPIDPADINSHSADDSHVFANDIPGDDEESLPADLLNDLAAAVDDLQDPGGASLDTSLQAISSELDQLEERRGW